MQDILNGLASLGPALGSVVVIGLVCKELLKMFDKHGDALKIVSENMHEHTKAMGKMGDNLGANTRVTERLAEIIEKKLKDVQN